MSDEIFSRLRIDEIVLEDTSAIGIREQRTWDHSAQIQRDVNGSLMTGSAMKSPWGKKARYVWSASGAGVLDLPGFDHLEHLDLLVIEPIDPWTFTIPAGVTTFVLPRTPVPGSVKLRHPLTLAPIEFEIATKTLTLEETVSKIKGQFVPELIMGLVDWDKDVDEDAQRYSWKLETAEV